MQKNRIISITKSPNLQLMMQRRWNWSKLQSLNSNQNSSDNWGNKRKQNQTWLGLNLHISYNKKLLQWCICRSILFHSRGWIEKAPLRKCTVFVISCQQESEENRNASSILCVNLCSILTQQIVLGIVCKQTWQTHVASCYVKIDICNH